MRLPRLSLSRLFLRVFATAALIRLVDWNSIQRLFARKGAEDGARLRGPCPFDSQIFQVFRPLTAAKLTASKRQSRTEAPVRDGQRLFRRMNGPPLGLGVARESFEIPVLPGGFFEKLRVATFRCVVSRVHGPPVERDMESCVNRSHHSKRGSHI